MRTADDPGALVRRLADLDEVRMPGVIRRGLGQDELDESQDDRQVIAEGMNRFGVEAGARTSKDVGWPGDLDAPEQTLPKDCLMAAIGRSVAAYPGDATLRQARDNTTPTPRIVIGAVRSVSSSS